MRDLIFCPSEELAKKYQELIVKPDKETKALIRRLLGFRGQVLVSENEISLSKEYLAEEITGLLISTAKAYSRLNSNKAVNFILTENGRLKVQFVSEAISRLSIRTGVDSNKFFEMLCSELKESLRAKPFIVSWGKVYVKEKDIIIEIKKDGFKSSEVNLNELMEKKGIKT